MLLQLIERARDRFRTCVLEVRRRLLWWSRPAASISLVLGTTTDLLRSRSELVAENALLRQQLPMSLWDTTWDENRMRVA